MASPVDALGNFLLIAFSVLIVFGLAGLIRTALRNRSWDFFFSYKSENANDVRRIAERLMAQGYRVWFAEYEILLRTYDEFRPRIRTGVQRCTYAVLFTTTRYADSEHCREEARLLQQRFAKKPERIIEVSLEEPNDARKQLGLADKSPRMIGSGDDAQLLTGLGILTGLDLSRGSVPPRSSFAERFRLQCAPISFQPSGFVLNEMTKHPDGTDIVYFSDAWPPVQYAFNLYVQPAPQTASGKPLTISVDAQDDRALYAELREYAQLFFGLVKKEGMPLKELGLHLVWKDGRTHLALTHSARTFMRKYAVIVGCGPRPTQLIFTFGVGGSFADFCRYVPLMDQVIDSIRMESGESAQS